MGPFASGLFHVESVMFLKFIYIVACVRTPFWWQSSIPLYGQTCGYPFIH